MDMKKKLDETYLPDKEARKSRVVIGLSGGLNSFVAAYLLKIQKYDLIAVTVLMSWDNIKEDSSKVLSCHLDLEQMENIKEFCHQMGIPHYTVKASDEFREEVVETWVSNRLTGTKANQCWNCHEIRMRFLSEKTKELEADWLATGHLAKMFRQEAHHSVYLHTSNDEVNDQAGILSRLPHHVLEKLMLPLSDLQQKEIDKLAENFGLNANSKKTKMPHCFDNSPLTKGYVEAHVSKRYLKPGEIMAADKVGDHNGVHFHAFGEVCSTLANQKTLLYMTKYNVTEKKIEVSTEDYFKRTSFFMRDCNFSEETSFSEPLKGVLKISDGEYADCWIYPKNFSCAIIELEDPQSVIEGEIVTILKKKGKNSKVYLTGKVKYILEEKPVMEQGKVRAKADYSNDF